MVGLTNSVSIWVPCGQLMSPQKWDQQQRKWSWQITDNEEWLYYETGKQIKLRVAQLNLEEDIKQTDGHLITGHCQEQGLGMVDWGWRDEQ